MGYIGSSSTKAYVDKEKGGNVTWKDNLSRYLGMIFDATGHEFEMYFKPSEEVPNLDDERFHSLLEAVNMPL